MVYDYDPLAIEVKCPSCGHSLVNPQLQLDDLPSIDLQAKVRDRLGHVFLSQVYGSYDKHFSGIEDLESSITQFSCPHCHEPFPVVELCRCGAPMIALQLRIGGLVKLCTRNGCRKHALEFEDADEMFELFESHRG